MWYMVYHRTKFEWKSVFFINFQRIFLNSTPASWLARTTFVVWKHNPVAQSISLVLCPSSLIWLKIAECPCHRLISFCWLFSSPLHSDRKYKMCRGAEYKLRRWSIAFVMKNQPLRRFTIAAREESMLRKPPAHYLCDGSQISCLLTMFSRPFRIVS